MNLWTALLLVGALHAAAFLLAALWVSAQAWRETREARAARRHRRREFFNELRDVQREAETASVVVARLGELARRVTVEMEGLAAKSSA
ncbi:hypothetical protein [Streptantibioticus silvisoli]|uniref:Uncharacterized protein n=1 Tax=Streptantibioticus silvisoli TaxID=2705255 RepID=A0ABT6W5N6_9ACTN|nr:hypothetical protein [Streptantibioticus silvisoli]MDI5965695.1 hypothetical protein [Streptantibioticus silvisoli]